MTPFSVISCSLSPNTTHEDIRAAWKVFLSPWKYNEMHMISACKAWFEHKYAPAEFRFFLTGRTSLEALLESFGIGQGDEVIIQAFTCMVVVNAIRVKGAIPIYADIDSSYNLSVQSIKKVITKKTKVIIVQHTFSIPADINTIVRYAHDNSCLVFEDCAHAFGVNHNGKPLGSFGDATFFSFGRDKSVSSVWGGAAMILSSGKRKIIRSLSKFITYKPSKIWVLKQVFHPILLSAAIATYTIGFGKLLIEVSKRIGIVSKPVTDKEKAGKSSCVAYEYPEELASLLWVQLKHIDMTMLHRVVIGRLYERELGYSWTKDIVPEDIAYLRYPVKVKHRDDLIKICRKHGILLGTWYSNVIDPIGSSLREAMYVQGYCPQAEKMALNIVNLPMRIPIKQANKIISIIKSHISYT